MWEMALIQKIVRQIFNVFKQTASPGVPSSTPQKMVRKDTKQTFRLLLFKNDLYIVRMWTMESFEISKMYQSIAVSRNY